MINILLTFNIQGDAPLLHIFKTQIPALNNQYYIYSNVISGQTIKQADVVLLGFPLMHVTDPIKRQRDLDVYENVTRSNGPAMTWSMHAIGHIELGNMEKAEEMFNRSYQPYKMEPFKVS